MIILFHVMVETDPEARSNHGYELKEAVTKILVFTFQSGEKTRKGNKKERKEMKLGFMYRYCEVEAVAIEGGCL